MSNLAAAFEGASQGLDELAAHANQREIAEASAMRAENLAQLKNYLTTHRELIVTDARTQALENVADHRTAGEHAARDEEIDRQEAGRARNRAVGQRRSLADAEALQDNTFTNQAELQARGRGRAARVQAGRDALVQASQARQQKAAIRDWLTKYAAQSHGDGSGTSHLANDPLDAQQLAQLAQHDAVLASQLRAYRDADAREQAATRAMGKFPSPYDTPSTPGAVAPANDVLASPPLIPYSGNEGPGVSDQPHPSQSGADEYMMSGTGDSSAQGAPVIDYCRFGRARMVLDPNREPMPPEKWERVKAQVRRNMRLIRMGRAKKRLRQGARPPS